MRINLKHEYNKSIIFAQLVILFDTFKK